MKIIGQKRKKGENSQKVRNWKREKCAMSPRKMRLHEQKLKEREKCAMRPSPCC